MEKKTFGKAAAILLLAAGATVIVTMFTDNGVERTDDAQVEQYISPVNVKVAGYIKEIRFTEHQFVHKGDTILIIDDREYAIALKQAEAQLMDARSGRKVIGNSVNTASSSATVLDASIDEAELRVEKLERDYRRYSALLEKKASTPVIVEQYKTELDMAKARVSALKRQREAARSTVNEVSQRQENADAAILRAEAAVDMARLNLSYTVITAPADGYFKETQMARIRPGQSVEITVDAMPGKRFAGTVTAISQATGSKYSMVPTDNSAGNFVKIQQRVPVRIDFNGSLSATDNSRMAAGMMCEIKVDVKDD